MYRLQNEIFSSSRIDLSTLRTTLGRSFTLETPGRRLSNQVARASFARPQAISTINPTESVVA